MNQTSQTIYSSTSTHWIKKLVFQFKLSSFGSWTKFNESVVESSHELYWSRLGSLALGFIITSLALVMSEICVLNLSLFKNILFRKMWKIS